MVRFLSTGLTFMKLALRWSAYGISAYVACTLLYRTARFDSAHWAAWRYYRFIEANATRPRLTPETVRSTFSDIPIPRKDHIADSNHTHASSARDRSDVSAFAELYAATIGLPAYFVQKSRADERQGRQGSKFYRVSKDTNGSVSVFYPDDDKKQPKLYVMIDIDHHLDMRSFMLTNFCPILLYSFQPETVARRSEEYSFFFQSDNQVNYSVTGGASYTHRVWNWSTDNLTLSDYDLFPLTTVVYLVDRRRVTEDHYVVLLTPVARWTWFGALLYRAISGPGLSYLSPVCGDTPFTRLEIVAPGGTMVSTGRVNSYNQVTVPADIDACLHSVARTSRVGLTLAQVKSYMNDNSVGAVALYEYLLASYKGLPPRVYPLKDSIRHYTFAPRNYDPEDKPSLVPFMPTLCHGGYAALLNRDNEVRMIEGRVLEVKSPELELTPFLARCMLEFVELLVPRDIKSRLHPADADEVYDRQDRPSQRRLLKEADVTGDHYSQVVKVFAKKEAAQLPADPRGISIICGTRKYCYSRYMYALADLVKELPWYAFSKNPHQIAMVVAAVASVSEFLELSDLSRCDGRISNLLRHLELLILLSLFHPSYHVELIELHRSQYHATAYATFGTSYETDFIRLSGSPETTMFNTIANKFIAYVAYRMTQRGGAYLTPAEAYGAPGVYGGDDGISSDLPSAMFAKACIMLGQKATVCSVKRGQPGVTFLSRQYSHHVWYGDPNSCCDIRRQLTKFNLTASLPPSVTPEMKLLEKVRSFLMSDANTPIIGDYCRHVLLHMHLDSETVLSPGFQISGVDAEITHRLRPWSANYSRDVQYPNEDNDGWMYDYCLKTMPKFDVKMFATWLRATKSLVDVMNPILCEEPELPEPKLPVVCDGDVVNPPVPGVTTPVQATAGRPATADRCEFYKVGRCKYGEKCTGGKRTRGHEIAADLGTLVSTTTAVANAQPAKEKEKDGPAEPTPAPAPIPKPKGAKPAPRPKGGQKTGGAPGKTGAARR